MKIRVVILLAAATLLVGCAGAEDKFAREVTKEREAVQLARETLSGGYELLTVAELKTLMDQKSDMILVDTMPLEDSYLKNHLPGAIQFLFPIKLV